MKLHYRQFGEGKPVILLHGIFGSSDNWVTIGRQLGEHFSVYIPDQRNHGQSPHSPVFNYYALVEDLREFIAELALENITLIGHSMGGKVAMSFALDQPRLVNQLVIIDISPGFNTIRQEHRDILRIMRAVDLTTISSRQEAEAELRKWPLSERIQSFILKNLYRSGTDRFAWRINLDAIEDNAELIFGPIPFSGRYPGPVLVIQGGDSTYITHDNKEVFNHYFPNVRFSIIPGASHWVHADKPDDMMKTLLDFLQGTERGINNG
ncbi:MAG: alpha/beta fold hydrolase [Bacteroidales bacterium]|nr:alpha/beta fold hydrolase [Lentimicrobiaceae bacterium]MDD5693690.1 alpha/beta fold hydrolase [Bacteroidales bacterium]